MPSLPTLRHTVLPQVHRLTQRRRERWHKFKNGPSVCELVFPFCGGQEEVRKEGAEPMLHRLGSALHWSIALGLRRGALLRTGLAYWDQSPWCSLGTSVGRNKEPYVVPSQQSLGQDGIMRCAYQDSDMTFLDTKVHKWQLPIMPKIEMKPGRKCCAARIHSVPGNSCWAGMNKVLSPTLHLHLVEVLKTNQNVIQFVYTYSCRHTLTQYHRTKHHRQTTTELCFSPYFYHLTQ